MDGASGEREQKVSDRVAVEQAVVALVARSSGGSRSRRPRSPRSRARARAEVLAGVWVEMADRQRLARDLGERRRGRRAGAGAPRRRPRRPRKSSSSRRSVRVGSGSAASSWSSSWKTAWIPRFSAACSDAIASAVSGLGGVEQQAVAVILDVTGSPRPGRPLRHRVVGVVGLLLVVAGPVAALGVEHEAELLAVGSAASSRG